MSQQDCRSRPEQQEQTQPNRAKDGPVHVLSPLVLKPVMMPVTAAIMMPRILTSDPRVRAASPRVYGYGLVSHAHHSAGAELLGIVPDQEQQISALHEGTMRHALKICCSPPG